MNTQLRLPIHIPITGKPYCGHVINRINEAAREETPEGSIVRIEQIYIKQFVK